MKSCVICGVPIPVGSAPNAKTCSKLCSKELKNLRNRKQVDKNSDEWYIGKSLSTRYTHYLSYETGKTACGRSIERSLEAIDKKTPECKICRKVLP